MSRSDYSKFLESAAKAEQDTVACLRRIQNSKQYLSAGDSSRAAREIDLLEDTDYALAKDLGVQADSVEVLVGRRRPRPPRANYLL